MRAIILLLLPFFSFAQKRTTSQNLNYFRYQISLQLSKKWSVKNEMENRSYFFAGRQNQFISKVTLENKQKTNQIFAVGMVYSKATSPQDPDADISTINNEIRPYAYFQQPLYAKNKSLLLGKFIEDLRFFQREGSCFHYGNVRSRFLLEYNYNLTQKLILKTYDEVLFNLLGREQLNFFDQQRFSFGGQYNFNKKTGFELVYQNWYQQQNNGSSYLDKNILKITLFQKVALK